MLRLYFISILLILATPIHAQLFQTIRGNIVDNASNTPVSFATVEVLHKKPSIVTASDSLGNFTLKVPVGRYDLQVSRTGYAPVIIREILAGSAKETFVSIGLNQHITALHETTVKPDINKAKPLNPMATVSARMFSVEETKRYAGGYDDPARLASSFAGVAGNTDANGIIIRGNAPKFVQWKMEGIEIPSPNHFEDLKTFGGGTLTALSSQMLSNSDFYTGAFPAEYSNALSGVFDLSMKKGNNQKRENTFQIGIIGIDAASEGPFKKGGRSSYLFNYRYSTLSLLAPLLPENANSLKYQDLSFKLNFPTLKAGIFSIWGFGLIDGAGAKAKADSLEWIYKNDRNEDAIKQYTSASGINHVYFLRHNAFIKTTLAATFNKLEWNTKRLDNQKDLQPFSQIDNTNWNFVLSSLINKKFNAFHTNKTGITVTGMKYRLYLNNSINNSTPQDIINTSGRSVLISAYTSSSINLTNRLKINMGVNGQIFTLNNHYTIEPRIGARQQLNSRQSLGFAYGLHSRLERLNFYFNNSQQTGEKAVNKNLDFTKAHHFVFSYDYKISDVVHLVIEPYFQQLFNVPVIADSSFSLLNLQGDWFFAHTLQNTGYGRNYGIDITIEKSLSQGYYCLFTASVFQAKYKGGDNIWRDTRYNRNYVFNFLAGKEWQTGKFKQNLASLNARITYQGGNRYSPPNPTASHLAGDIVYDEQNAFVMQVSPSLNVHFTGSYRINKKNASHEFALKILNATAQPDFYGYKYNLINKTIDKDVSSVIIPNLSYKIEF